MVVCREFYRCYGQQDVDQYLLCNQRKFSYSSTIKYKRNTHFAPAFARLSGLRPRAAVIASGDARP